MYFLQILINVYSGEMEWWEWVHTGVIMRGRRGLEGRTNTTVISWIGPNQ